MNRQTVLMFNPTEYTIEERELEIDLSQRVDEIYYKTELGMIPVAYFYNPNYREEIETVLDSLRAKQKEFRTLEGKVFHKILPKYRL